MSKQRDLIERIIKESMLHLTAEEIYKEARKEMPNISLGTVYRNLGNLVDEKCVSLKLRLVMIFMINQFIPMGMFYV